MQEENSNGQKRQKPDREPFADGDTLGLGAAITITLGSVMLIAGFVSAMSSGYKVGPYAGFAGGLTAIIVATTMVNGGIALLCHRQHAKARDKITTEIRELRQDVRTLIVMLAERETSDDDQVGAVRRSHEN